MSTPLPNYVTLSTNVVFQNLDDEAVLLDLLNGQYFGLNPVGTRMWQLLATKEGHVATVLAQLQAEYDIEPDQLKRDFSKLVADLAAANLVVVA